tara:strand:- start:5528 stop:6211 length:684 start_codon:yes stop_codon:yes gene_type:complete
MIVAIHQPNYLPWAGYFQKILKSDLFIFLDDAQFTKNSYINRTKILQKNKNSWLTIPAKPKLGTPINEVMLSQCDWPKRHLDKLYNNYVDANAFKTVWQDIQDIYVELPSSKLAESNILLIERICKMMGIKTKFSLSSMHKSKNNLFSEKRLVELVSVSGGSVYLSGRGALAYQNKNTFDISGIVLEYSEFEPKQYTQIAKDFVPGLSILDVIFHLGWQGATDYISV